MNNGSNPRTAFEKKLISQGKYWYDNDDGDFIRLVELRCPKCGSNNTVNLSRWGDSSEVCEIHRWVASFYDTATDEFVADQQ